MASTYSTLKIELIATGEQSGTWGVTTNTNLGTAIEEAVVGRATANFSSDADLTISLTNTNATQTARNYILNVTSGVSLSTTRNLIVPTINKPYIIENNTTGGQSIIVKTAAGTGITVPNGKVVMVYADGTNVVSALTHIPTVTLGSALATGSGGTGLTGFTAGNNAIYSTSSSALAAGTLPSAAGGTGLTTFTAANNALYSTSSSALTAGTLPSAAGGTGLTGFTAANNAIYSTSSSALTAGTLPIAAGGTGATTASAALAALGGVSPGKSIALAMIFGF